MKSTIVLITLASKLLTSHIGIATHENFIQFSDGTGYYTDVKILEVGQTYLEINGVLYSQLSSEVIHHD